MDSEMVKAITKAKARLGMTEAVFLSVAGQGGTTAMHVLCNALRREDKFFNVTVYSRGTMRGGPVYHVLRMGSNPLMLPKSQITQPDYMVLFDESKITVDDPASEDFMASFQSGLLIVNSPKSPQELYYPWAFSGEAICVNVNEIAETMSRMRPAPPGLAIAALFAGVTQVVSSASLEQAVEDYFSHHGLHVAQAARLVPANLNGARRAYEAGQSAKRVHLEGLGVRTKTVRHEKLDEIGDSIFPDSELPPYQSGKNSSMWRDYVSVWSDANCIRCDCCYSWLYCPDQCIDIKRPGQSGKAYDVVVDLGYCKGCGVCEEVCPAGALSLRRADLVAGALP